MANGVRKTGHFKKRSPSRGSLLPVNPQQTTRKRSLIVRLPLVIQVQDEREDLYRRVKKLIMRLETTIYADKTKTPLKIRAIHALADLVSKATGVLSDYEVEELERETEELEKEAEGTGAQDSDPKGS